MIYQSIPPPRCVTILYFDTYKFTKVILPLKYILMHLNHISKHFDFPFKNVMVMYYKLLLKLASKH